MTPAPAVPLLRFAIALDGRRVEVGLPAGMLAAAPGAAPAGPEAGPAEGPAEGDVPAPVAGTLLVWQAGEGAEVAAGEVIAVMEAMKMETRVEAPRSGRLRHLAEAGKPIGFGAPLARIDPA